MDSNKIFEQLKSILKTYENKLVVVHDEPDYYYLGILADPKCDYFGMVQIKKNYVSFHLMPVYSFPQLLENISDELKKRMQGKSCFNFKNEDKNLFTELEKLTQSGFEKYRQEGRL